MAIIFISWGRYTGEGVIIASYVVVPLSPLLGLGVVIERVIGFSRSVRSRRCVRFSREVWFSRDVRFSRGVWLSRAVRFSRGVRFSRNLFHISIKLDE